MIECPILVQVVTYNYISGKDVLLEEIRPRLTVHVAHRASLRMSQDRWSVFERLLAPYLHWRISLIV